MEGNIRIDRLSLGPGTDRETDIGPQEVWCQTDFTGCFYLWYPWLLEYYESFVSLIYHVNQLYISEQMFVSLDGYIHVYVNDIDFSCVLLLPVALLDHGSVCDINITFHPSVNILVFSETTGSNVTKLAEYLLLLHLYKVCCSNKVSTTHSDLYLLLLIYLSLLLLTYLFIITRHCIISCYC